MQLLSCVFAVSSTRSLIGIHINADQFDSHSFTSFVSGLSSVYDLSRSGVFACITNSNGMITNEDIHTSLVASQVLHFYATDKYTKRFCTLEHPDVEDFDYLLQLDYNIDLLLRNITNLVAPTISDNFDIIYISKQQVMQMREFLSAERDSPASSLRTALSSETQPIDSQNSCTNKYQDYPTMPFPPRAAIAKYHSSGPCNLWWPLDGSEIFLHSTYKTDHIEPMIFNCPTFNDFLLTSPHGKAASSRRRRVRRVLHVQVHLASPTDPSPATPPTVLTNQYLSAEEVSFDEAIQIMVPTQLPPNATHVRLVLSVCNMNVHTKQVSPSDCYVTFNVVVKVVYGDQVPLVRPSGAWHPMMASMGTRDIFGHALHMMGHRDGTFVEVGVNRGHFAQLMLNQWGGSRYIMVDPWMPAPVDEYVDIANVVTIAAHDAVMQEAIKNVGPFGDRPVVIRNTSVGAAALLVNNTVDVVYIDGLHHYAGVMDDIEAWWPKLKVGGIMAGHDYYLTSEAKTIFTVKPAVDEFARNMGLVVFQTHDAYPTWFVLKE